MVRKNYPFNQRDSDRMTRKLIDLFTVLIGTPYLLSRGISNSDLDAYSLDKPKEINPNTIKITNIICGICYFLCPFIGALFVTEFGWWVFFALILSSFLELCFSMAIPSPFEIRNVYIFTHSKLKDQIDVCKLCFKFWSIINIVHIGLSILIFVIILFNLHYRLFDYDIQKWNTFMPWSSFLLSLSNISIYTIFLIVGILYFKIKLALEYIHSFKMTEEYVKQNPFYKKMSTNQGA